MNKPTFPLAAALLGIVLFGSAGSSGQKLEISEGTRVVHNQAPGSWDRSPPIRLQPVAVLGDVDSDDENIAFHMPTDLALDAQGRIYVLDMGNDRIQVFDAGGKFVRTIGRRGQGPGEFTAPNSIDLDPRGNITVCESQAARIQTISPEGKVLRMLKITEGPIGDLHLLGSGGFVSASGLGGGMIMLRMNQPQETRLPPLLKILDADGRIRLEFGPAADFGALLINQIGNQVQAALDADDNIYAVFPFQNRIEKYSPDGTLLWRADRTLGYPMEIKARGEVKNSVRSDGDHTASFQLPEMTRCAAGAAVDGKGRLWVVTLSRQLRENEKVSVTMTQTSGGGGGMGKAKTQGAVDVRTTDAFKLEVYGPDGFLLGSIPVTTFVDGIFIEGDRLFLLDKVRGVQFREFKIVG